MWLESRSVRKTDGKVGCLRLNVHLFLAARLGSCLACFYRGAFCVSKKVRLSEWATRNLFRLRALAYWTRDSFAASRRRQLRHTVSVAHRQCKQKDKSRKRRQTQNVSHPTPAKLRQANNISNSNSTRVCCASTRAQTPLLNWTSLI